MFCLHLHYLVLILSPISLSFHSVSVSSRSSCILFSRPPLSLSVAFSVIAQILYLSPLSLSLPSLLSLLFPLFSLFPLSLILCLLYFLSLLYLSSLIPLSFSPLLSRLCSLLPALFSLPHLSHLSLSSMLYHLYPLSLSSFLSSLFIVLSLLCPLSPLSPFSPLFPLSPLFLLLSLSQLSPLSSLYLCSIPLPLYSSRPPCYFSYRPSFLPRFLPTFLIIMCNIYSVAIYVSSIVSRPSPPTKSTAQTYVLCGFIIRNWFFVVVFTKSR